MYYLKYNGIDLTQLVKVREVSLPSLPSIEHNDIEIWEMDGNLFSSLSYGNKEIELTAIIQPLDPNDLDVYVNDVKRAFFVREPKPLFLGDETRYLLAVPEGEVEIVELGKGTCELSVSFVAYYPFWIDKEVMNIPSNGKLSTIINEGDVPTTPIMNIGILGNTTFLQVENVTTGESVFIGELPRVQRPNAKANENVLTDFCQATAGWTSSQAAIDADCGTGGTLAVTSTEGGFCAGSFGNANTTWKGACYRKSLDSSVKDFRVRANFSFTSSGINGDPTRVEYKTYDEGLENYQGGEITYTYKVRTTEETLDIRSYPCELCPIIGTYKKDDEIEEGRIVNGWLEHWYNGQMGYCSMQYIEVIAHDNRFTGAICNFVTSKSTALRAGADEWSLAHTTIPSGTVIRCFVEEEGESGKFRKLQTPYNGQWGYVASSDIIRASEAGQKIEYVLEGETSDDKTGKIQLYGFSSAGVQLFSLSLIDDSQFFESTYPLIKKNGQTFLEDTSFNLPKANQKEVQSGSGSEVTIKYESLLSGTYGNWNDFQGDLIIERKGDTWWACISKGNGATLQSSRVIDKANSEESLSYLVIYIATSNTGKPSAMSINEIQVQTLSDLEGEEYNIQRFEENDVIEIDFGKPCVKLNKQIRNDLVDITSQFFDLQVGRNDIRISTDSNVIFNTLFNKKYL